MPRTHRLPFLAVIALFLSAVLVAAFATAARANSTLLTVMQDDKRVLSDPIATLNAFRSLGVTHVRIFMGWGSIAPRPNSRSRPSGFRPSDPGSYPAGNWAPYDAAARAAAERGIGVDFVLAGPAPLWATTPSRRSVSSHNAHVYEPSFKLFGAFVKAVGKRYNGRFTPSGSSTPLPDVKFWSIWNEPNYGYQLAPQAVGGAEVAPYLYRGLLNAAWSALSATGHGHNTILIGETAPRGANVPGVANGMVPLRFLRALYCVDSNLGQLRGSAASARGCPRNAGASRRFRAQNPALFNASGFAAHLYTSGQSSRPDLPNPPHEPDYAGLFNVRKLERTLDHLQRVYGSHTKLPIYNTEFGFQTNPPRPTCGCVFLSPDLAAYYLNWSEYLEYSDRRIRSDAQYLLYDAAGTGGSTSASGFSSGLLFLNGKPKSDFAAFQLPLYLPTTATKHGRSLLVWGQVRPAPYAQQDSGLQQQVAIEFKPASGGAWTTASIPTITNSAGYFKAHVVFPSSGSVRLQWAYPIGFTFLPSFLSPVVTSRTQAITIH